MLLNVEESRTKYNISSKLEIDDVNFRSFKETLETMGESAPAALFKVTNSLVCRNWKDIAPTVAVAAPSLFGLSALALLAGGIASKDCNNSCRHIPSANCMSRLSLYYEKKMGDVKGVRSSDGTIKLRNGRSFTKSIESINLLPETASFARKDLTCNTRSFEKKLQAIQDVYSVSHQEAGNLFSRFTQHPTVIIGSFSSTIDGLNSMADFLPESSAHLMSVLTPSDSMDQIYRSPAFCVTSAEISKNTDWLDAIEPRLIIIEGTKLKITLPKSWNTVPKIVLLTRRSASHILLLEKYRDQIEHASFSLTTQDFKCLETLDSKVVQRPLNISEEMGVNLDDDDW
jgi:hypothetical protein